MSLTLTCEVCQRIATIKITYPSKRVIGVCEQHKIHYQRRARDLGLDITVERIISNATKVSTST